VKYKVLKSVCHNFSHSFVSFSNYVDDGYVIDDLRNAARKANGEKVRIFWIPNREQDPTLTKRVKKSVELWKADLPRLVTALGSTMEAISEFETDIYMKPDKQLAVEGVLTDNRGRVYRSQIYNF
jgi:predicted phosphoadenosine phosphosulfate sulfurtransferase